MNGQGACIVQNDQTVLLDTSHPEFEEAREKLSGFAELVKNPAMFHTYRITPLSLWNAAAAGWTPAETVETLHSLSRWDVPAKVKDNIVLWMSRYGQLVLQPSGEEEGSLALIARSGGSRLPEELLRLPSLKQFGLKHAKPDRLIVKASYRGLLKQELTRLGYPVLDEAGYRKGAPLSFGFRSALPGGGEFRLRDYQQESILSFLGIEGAQGSGVLVLPCGAGKTVIGLGVIERVQCETLILTSNITSVRQWIHELLAKTTLRPEQIGEYSGERKEVRPVTVSTYQILTHRSRKGEGFKHMPLLSGRDWGLIIYDEVHLLPAPVFRATADIQATRRLGLTATLVREDGCERDVFSLIGPKQKEVAWKELEAKGWIAEVDCCEVRVPMEQGFQKRYEQETGRGKFRIAAENPGKTAIVRQLIERHGERQILIIGQYVGQLKALAAELGIPLITGAMPQAQRSELYSGFREGTIRVLAVSKVANFAVDLPDASVAIQISGSFGSRQEEAQRLGRILRPKRGDNRAFFYSLVSDQTREQEFAERRQLFLIEQGYEYKIRFAGPKNGETGQDQKEA
ncbi:DNA repair helicase XPB [Paenibacillus caui]|uniref:DNA repair helicase XPB n=1 Tax=Paenibacillus caui TaxID=2873927 RepID=UPI001CA9F716|nr:DNA repair helicase XPB [Paenibacillus caui]